MVSYSPKIGRVRRLTIVVTYYITALPQFQSLDTCAQSGISSVILAVRYETPVLLLIYPLTHLQQSDYLCGSGPGELASCVCLKSGMSKVMSSSLTSMVKYYCENTAIGDVTSAIEVFQYFCSAVEGEVVATVRESVAQTYQTYPTASSGEAATTSAASQTGTSSSASTSTAEEDESQSEEENSTNIGAIAGGVAGAVAVIGLGIGLFFFLRFRRRRQARGEEISKGNGNPVEYTGKPELMGNSEFDKDYGPRSELATSPRSELDGGRSIMELHAHPSKHVSPLQEGYELPAHSQGWQSGPVEMYELDSSGKNR